MLQRHVCRSRNLAFAATTAVLIATTARAEPSTFTNTIGMKMVLIPPGEFQMGSSAEEIKAWNDWFSQKEGPKHNVIDREKLPTPAMLGQRGADRFGEMLRGPQTGEVQAGLLSGLALAGANRAGQAEAGEPLAGGDSDDGILTAEEIGTQNLDGVQLVVLSACKTGLGKVAAGEGLLGLQRAFQSAGARTVVASLWSVPDDETRMLMEKFYTNLWRRKQGALASLREAQLAMLHCEGKAGKQRGVVRVVEDDPSGDVRLSPRYWAAFVLNGDWK